MSEQKDKEIENEVKRIMDLINNIFDMNHITNGIALDALVNCFMLHCCFSGLSPEEFSKKLDIVKEDYDFKFHFSNHLKKFFIPQKPKSNSKKNQK